MDTPTPEPREKPRRRWLLWATLAIVTLLGAWLLLQPEGLRRLAVAGLSDDYRPDPANLEQAVAAAAAARGKHALDISLESVATGIAQPTDLVFVPSAPGQAIVLERGGTARWLKPESGRHGRLLHIDVLTVSEQGLLGIALHPRFADNGRFFLNYVAAREGEHRSVIEAWQLSDPRDPSRATAKPQGVLLEVTQPYQNHNAGQLAFGPDGYLYVGFGDGGFRDDPEGHGQNLKSLKGAMLRIDVDRKGPEGTPYAIPADNPFVGKPDVRPEIWAYGLRNPWRYSFDDRGRLVVADVGQDTWEEVDLVQAGDNLGWVLKEGFSCFGEGKAACEKPGLVDPVFVYGRSDGSSITGGHVYKGSAIPALRGRYVFGDFVSGRIFAIRLPDDRRTRVRERLELGKWPLMISAFARDPEGELFLAAYARGEIYKMRPPKSLKRSTAP
ncbi:MAG: PQQ-dependent sugar dehydrogenase [Myxococcales bacterium]|nr:PQQ-dependent sugar dehydrogenase [Myxococcales bacterium]